MCTLLINVNTNLKHYDIHDGDDDDDVYLVLLSLMKKKGIGIHCDTFCWYTL
jgi:hypothetical protein